VDIILNGEPHQLSGPLTAAELLERLGLRREGVVVERNETIIRRDQLDQVTIAGGDRIEVIQMIAGG